MCIPVFRPKRPKIHTLWDGTFLHGLYKGLPPGGGGENSADLGECCRLRWITASEVCKVLHHLASKTKLDNIHCYH